jgi:cyclic pyranopterin phosphate synthase
MSASPRLTHLDEEGAARMVDVSAKAATARTAVAEGRIRMSAAALEAIKAGALAKGDALAVARVAGILAAKRTAELIPLCHPLGLNSVSIDLMLEETGVRARCEARTTHQTGVEMEALTGVCVALLTIYDMAKSLDRQMEIEGVRLVAKSGGRSGDWTRPDG